MPQICPRPTCRTIMISEETAGAFTADELLQLLETDRPELFVAAARTARANFGGKIYFRALIEISSFCHNGCYYCGLRAGNRQARRYRMTIDEILQSCDRAAGAGYRTFVLQGGEDPLQDDGWITELVGEVRREFPDCSITLSVGERSDEAYRDFREAGADRYLLRHETASGEHYRRLHPESMSLENRKRCLYELKELGYQTGAGMMIGSPFQRLEDIVADIAFLRELQPQMIGVGPFIPASGTPFGKESPGSMQLTLKVLSILRLLFPHANMPSTTALSSLRPSAELIELLRPVLPGPLPEDGDCGDLLGLAAGANVIMTDFTPAANREKYSIYDHKDPSVRDLRRYEDAGWTVSMERGDNFR